METILVVEDDVDIRESLLDLLAAKGYAATGAANGAEALEILEGGIKPCLILLDLMLPEMSGWEFRRRQMRDDRWSSIPVVLISGMQKLDQESQQLQAIAFLPKPIDFALLYRTLERYC